MEKSSREKIGRLFQETVYGNKGAKQKVQTKKDKYIHCNHVQLRNAVKKAYELRRIDSEVSIPEGRYKVLVMTEEQFDSPDIDKSNAIIYKVPGCVILAKFE